MACGFVKAEINVYAEPCSNKQGRVVQHAGENEAIRKMRQQDGGWVRKKQQQHERIDCFVCVLFPYHKDAKLGYRDRGAKTDAKEKRTAGR